MEQRAIKALLEQVAAGQVDVDDALLRLKMEPFGRRPAQAENGAL